MNLKPLHLVNLDGRLKDGNIVPCQNTILQWLDIGGIGKEIQHG